MCDGVDRFHSDIGASEMISHDELAAALVLPGGSLAEEVVGHRLAYLMDSGDVWSVHSVETRVIAVSLHVAMGALEDEDADSVFLHRYAAPCLEDEEDNDAVVEYVGEFDFARELGELIEKDCPEFVLLKEALDAKDRDGDAAGWLSDGDDAARAENAGDIDSDLEPDVVAEPVVVAGAVVPVAVPWSEALTLLAECRSSDVAMTALRVTLTATNHVVSNDAPDDILGRLDWSWGTTISGTCRGCGHGPKCKFMLTIQPVPGHMDAVKADIVKWMCVGRSCSGNEHWELGRALKIARGMKPRARKAAVDG
jgi:hypothetical protein